MPNPSSSRPDEESDFHPTSDVHVKKSAATPPPSAPCSPCPANGLEARLARMERKQDAQAVEVQKIHIRLAKGDARLDDSSKHDASLASLSTNLQALSGQIIELRTKLGVLWAIAGTSGVAAIGALISAIAALLTGHSQPPVH